MTDAAHWLHDEIDYPDDDLARRLEEELDETDCGREIAIGVEDSATCDIPRTVRHDRHEGPCSLGGRASWSGGGTCAGDPLPVRNLTLIPDPPSLGEAQHLSHDLSRFDA